MSPFRRFCAAFAAAVTVSAAGITAASADNVSVAGDGLTTFISPSTLQLSACTNTPVSGNVIVAITRNGPVAGNPQTFAENSNVTLSATAPTAGLSATFSPGTIPIPIGWLAAAPNTKTGTSTATIALPAKAAAGSGTITLVASGTSSAGGTTTRTFALTVSWTVRACDQTPPVLALPGTITAEATGPNGAAVTYAVSATDETAPLSPAVTCSPASGSTFALGTTAVSCSASDAAGNTATGSFSVVVQDTTPPVVGAMSNVQMEAVAAGTVVTWVDPTATDVVDGTLATTCSPASGWTFPVGTTTVTCSATDAHHNTGSGGFTVTITDTTAPNLVLPSDLTAEATGPTGAQVTFQATAIDAVDGLVTVTCSPTSGSLFALGTSTVTCSAADLHGNPAEGSFTVTVVDTTPPVLTLPDPMTVEATGPAGATVTFTATAEDLVDGPVSPVCTPASGATFALGSTTVSCTATDAAGNAASDTFPVTVVDTTPPDLTLPGPIEVEATGPDGAVVTYAASATDLVDLNVVVSCLPASGSTFSLGSHQVDCTATDASGNTATGSFLVSVVDTVGPEVTITGTTPVEATGPDGAPVTFTATAVDLVSGTVAATCSPASGATFPLGDTTVLCSAVDGSGNSGSATWTVTVRDTTAPTITWVGGPADGASYVFGSAPPAGTCTAFDLVSLGVVCTVTGYSTAVGTHTLTATATDGAGNTTTVHRSYAVTAWTLGGFYQPVDMNGVWNVVKNGSTVPLKFEVFAGSTELTSTSAIAGFTVKGVACPNASAVTDDIELTTTGGTSLRYDATAGQFIQNWQTPKKPGACYQVTMTTADGSSLSALFKLK